MFTIGVGVFTAASALSAVSPSVGALIAARALQGAGAAIVMPLTLTLISEAFPTEKRGVAIGLWGGIQGLAVAAGPVVGGAIAGGISWHWIFWLNLPIGLALMPLAARRLNESFGPRPQLDLVGLVLAGVAAFGVTWALVRAESVGWGSVEIIGSLVGGLVLAGFFLEWELRARAPMLQLEFFRDRTFASANAASFFMWAALFGTLFLMAQFFQIALGNSPLGAGLRLLPWTGAPMVVAPIAGALSERYGNRPFIAGGLALQTIGLAWVALIAAPGMGYLQLGLALTVAGVGISMCFPTVANAVMGSVPLSEAGVASGTNSMLRELGGVLGIAVLASVFARQGAYHSPRVFIDGFTQALWVGVGFSALGCAAALLAPGHRRTVKALPAPAVLATHEPIGETTG
jgi:EmrB/QacA subfamily drug resistance transporter